MIVTRSTDARTSRAIRSPAPERGPGLRALALVALLAGYAMAVLDFFVVNVALPTIGSSLHAGTSALELVVYGYGVSFAVLLVLGGRLGDAFGRRRLFMAGVAGFTASSFACGMAPSAWVLVGARAAQGATAAVMVPQVLATIQALTQGEERTRAMGRYGATAAISSAAGQVLGGVVLALDIAGSGWRGIFLVNVPVGLVALAACRRWLTPSRADRPTGTDPVGTALLAGALLSFLMPLSEGASLGWPAWSFAVLATAPVLAGGFAFWERRWEARGGTPLVPSAVLRPLSMRASLGTTLPFFSAFSGFMFVYALATQRGPKPLGLGLGPLDAGLAFVPAAVAFGVGSLASPALLRRFGPRIVAAGTAGQCAAMAGLSLAMLATWPNVSVIAAELLLVLLGLGQGCAMSPMFRLALSGVEGHQAGAGSGVLVTTQQLAIAVGATLLGTVYSRALSGLGGAGGLACALGVMALFAGVGSFMARGLARTVVAP